MKFSIIAIFALGLSNTQAFTTPRFSSTSVNTRTTTSIAMEGKDFSESPTGKSRFDGNQREPTIQEISIMDDMITKMSKAKPYELPNAVSKAIRVVSSPRFFMRIAERVDMAENDVEKEQLSALAANLVTTIEAVVSSTEEKLDDRAKAVETVVKAAAVGVGAAVANAAVVVLRAAVVNAAVV